MASLPHDLRMTSTVSDRGHLSDARHIELDQPADRPWGPVEVIRRAVVEEPKDHASIVGLFLHAERFETSTSTV
jgi:hypothetical protein